MEYKNNLIETHIVKIIDNKIEFLLLKRSSKINYPNIWQMITGKIQNGEKAYEAAIREVNEETSLILSKLFIVPNVNSFYNAFDDSVNFVPVFVGIVAKEDTVRISEEHQEFLWVKKKKAMKLLAWPGQAKSVKIICDYFNQKKENLNFVEIPLKGN